jgi:putative transposase
MYSYEDRINAVRLYLKLGKRVGVTIRRLGYPTKNTLLGWYREHVATQGLRAGYRRSKDKFTAEQKQHAVQHYLDETAA